MITTTGCTKRLLSLLQKLGLNLANLELLSDRFSFIEAIYYLTFLPATQMLN